MATVDVELGPFKDKPTEKVVQLVPREPAPAPGKPGAPLVAYGESPEDAQDAYRNIVAEALERISRDAGGIAWLEVWAKDGDGKSDILRLQTSWVAKNERMVAGASLAARLATAAQPCAPGNGLAGMLYLTATQSAVPSLHAPLDWRKLREIIDDPELPDDDFAEALEAALPGADAAGVASRDGNVMVLVVTLPPEADDARAPPQPCTRPSAAPMLRASAEALLGLIYMRR